MSEREVSLDVRGRARVTAAQKRKLQTQLLRAMTAARAEGTLSLSLTDDAELHWLNQQYAGEDHATDVLSFEQPASRRHALLGDVIISVPTARRQAKDSLEAELLHLAVHGLCHLLGYDHASKREEKVMFDFETQLRAQAKSTGAVVSVARPKKITSPRVKINSPRRRKA